MRDFNSMGRWTYILESVIYSVLAAFWYKRVLFANLLGFDDDTSKWVLYISAGVLVAIGVRMTIERRRNNVSLIINIAFPFCVYTVIAYMNYLRSFIVVLLIIAVIASIVYVVLTKKYAASVSGKKQRHFNFSRFSVLGVRTIITSCTSLVVVYLIASTVTGIQLFNPKSQTAESSVSSFVEYYEDNADVFDKLEQHTWETLSPEEKLDVLQVVCNGEKAKLGIKDPICIKSKVFRNDLLGEFVAADNTVLINAKHLENDSSYSVVKTVAHECYHSYERSLVKLYDAVDEDQKRLMAFDHAVYYKEEFANYHDGESEEYYFQAVEVDARDYSEKAAEDYRDKILSHLEYSRK